MATKQEMFNMVVTHLRAQGRRAQIANGLCRYRTDTGLKCAIGCLIPDELYSPWLENSLTSDLLSRPGLRELLTPSDAPGLDAGDFLAGLQRAHDTTNDDHAGPGVFESNLRRFAECWKLDLAAPTEVADVINP